MTTTLVRSTRSLRRLRETAREALRAVRALEEATSEVDVFGRYTIAPTESVDMDEVSDFLNLAREMNPNREITLIVTAREGEDKENDGTAAVRLT